MKLFALMGLCRDHFWKEENNDPHNPDPLTLDTACLQTVEKHVKNEQLARQLVDELAKQRFPVVAVEASASWSWLEFFTMTISRSIAERLLTNKDIQKENRRRYSS